MNSFNPLKIGDLVAQTIMKNHEVLPSYTTDLGLEGLLYLYDASQNDEYLNHVLKVWDFRESKNASNLNVNILFTCLHFETFLRTGDLKYISSFSNEAEKWIASVPRDQDGAVCCIIRPELKRIFIDMLQGYAVFMARAGWLKNDNKFFNECITQYEIFRVILRNPETGLWHHGRNWGKDPGFISPGHWNRGQGLVLRGMVDSLDYLPAGSSYFNRMKTMLEELAADIIKYQDPRGMWHQLTDYQKAYPETSGTSLFVHYIYKAFHRGWFKRDPYLFIAEKGINALMGYVQKDGIVMNTSQGTYPLTGIEGYLHRPSIPGDPDAAGTMLMACAGPYLARDPKTLLDKKT
jgi:unsaturated rhamnogalacturonyl hydrolase